MKNAPEVKTQRTSSFTSNNIPLEITKHVKEPPHPPMCHRFEPHGWDDHDNSTDLLIAECDAVMAAIDKEFADTFSLLDEKQCKNPIDEESPSQNVMVTQETIQLQQNTSFHLAQQIFHTKRDAGKHALAYLPEFLNTIATSSLSCSALFRVLCICS